MNLKWSHPIISVIYCKYIWDKSNIIPLSLIPPHYSAPSAYLLSPAAFPPPETPPVLALNFVDGIMRGLIHDHVFKVNIIMDWRIITGTKCITFSFYGYSLKGTKICSNTLCLFGNSLLHEEIDLNVRINASNWIYNNN